jgi:hypothetical protein
VQEDQVSQKTATGAAVAAAHTCRYTTNAYAMCSLRRTAAATCALSLIAVPVARMCCSCSAYTSACVTAAASSGS